jgi:hypothetical protein
MFLPCIYFYNPPRNRRTIWRAKHIKVKAFTAIVNPVAAFVAAVPLVKKLIV